MFLPQVSWNTSGNIGGYRDVSICHAIYARAGNL
jgi:hypothetical protein